MLAGHEVTVLDNMFTGRRRNIEHWLGHPNFELVRHDIVDPYMVHIINHSHSLAMLCHMVALLTNVVIPIDGSGSNLSFSMSCLSTSLSI
jgi:nucleoside-diphosphate-sugar epimerase